ncbi:MAG: hypothetical protein RL708_1671 [Bacteroidota bacterium]|jgi:hypothetical protein
MNLKFQITDFKLMKKSSLVLLSILFFCKISVAQKINLPDSLPFTLEYIDSTTFAKAKSLNIEFVRDTSDFKWDKDSLLLYKNGILKYGMMNHKIKNYYPDLMVIHENSGNSFEYLGTIKNKNNNVYLINEFDSFLPTYSFRFAIIPTKNAYEQIYGEQFLVSNDCIFIMNQNEIGDTYRVSFYVFRMRHDFFENSFQYNLKCEGYPSKLNPFNCFFFQESKMLSNEIFLIKGADNLFYKEIYLKLTLKK